MNLQDMRRHFPADLSYHAGLFLHSKRGRSLGGAASKSEAGTLDVDLPRLGHGIRVTAAALVLGGAAVVALALLAI